MSENSLDRCGRSALLRADRGLQKVAGLTTSEIRTGVIGLGYFGSFHARQHAANPKGRLVAVVDADRARAEAVAAQYGAMALFDHRELFGKVDAVSITVPTSLHHAVAADFIDAGIHVLIEKPICDTPDAARDLIARAEAKGVVLQIGHIERFSPVFGLLRDKVKVPTGATLAGGRAGTGDACTSFVGASSALRAATLLPTAGVATVDFVESEGAPARASCARDADTVATSAASAQMSCLVEVSIMIKARMLDCGMW